MRRAAPLGWLYVVERATLLHEMARRHVRSCLPSAAHADKDVADQIVAAARDAFATRRNWLGTEALLVARA